MANFKPNASCFLKVAVILVNPIIKVLEGYSVFSWQVRYQVVSQSNRDGIRQDQQRMSPESTTKGIAEPVKFLRFRMTAFSV